MCSTVVPSEHHVLPRRCKPLRRDVHVLKGTLRRSGDPGRAMQCGNGFNPEFSWALGYLGITIVETYGFGGRSAIDGYKVKRWGLEIGRAGTRAKLEGYWALMIGAKLLRNVQAGILPNV